MAKNNSKQAKGGMLYRFVARHSVIIPAMIRGFKQNIKFSTTFEGSSHYSTSDKDKAAAVRASEYFKSGVIREVESVPVQSAQMAQKTAVESAPTQAAPWLASMKSVTGGQGAMSRSVKNAVKKNAALKGSAQNEALKPGAQNEAQNEGDLFSGGSEDETEKLTLEEVDNYTDAKNYLRDEMGMPEEVMARDDVARWAAEKGVVFPNFEF